VDWTNLAQVVTSGRLFYDNEIKVLFKKIKLADGTTCDLDFMSRLNLDDLNCF
jgi:hypothetical protein